MTEALARIDYDELHLKVQQAFKRTGHAFLELADILWEACEAKIWERYRCADPARYFDQYHGASYRTVRRLLSIREALEVVPAEERRQLKAAYAEIGVSKSAVISTAVKHGHDWHDLVENARDVSEDQLQAHVSKLTGALPRGATAEPGQRLYRFLHANVPPDQQILVEEAFELGRKVTGSRNPHVILGAMLMEAISSWSGRSSEQA